jgi:hypothetical protein
VAMPLSARALNRATLGRQLLLERARLDVTDGVRRVVALQAQEPASPYVALWTRLQGFDAADLDRAFASQEVVKGPSIRVTLHAVHADDHPAFHRAILPRLRAAGIDERFRVAGLTTADVDGLIAEVLAHASVPRSNADMEAWTDDRLAMLGQPGLWGPLRACAPLVHAPAGGPWTFGQRPMYVAPPNRDLAGDPEHALQHLARRYLEGFGPASVVDIAQFTMIQRQRVRAALEALGDELVRIDGPAREPLYDVAGGVLPDEDTAAPPRLLGMWEETLLAYDDRTRIVPEEYRKVVTRVNGDVLPTLLVDGYVAGVWRPVEGGIEATAFHPLEDETWAGLDAEARALRAFLADRDPLTYRRYGHWWAKLPEGVVRTLGG